MSVSNVNFAKLIGVVLGENTKLKTYIKTLAGTTTFLAGYPKLWFLDPGGATRIINLPPETNGDFYIITNTADAAEDLTVKEDSSTTTIGTIGQNETGVLVCDGTTWRIIVGVA